MRYLSILVAALIVVASSCTVKVKTQDSNLDMKGAFLKVKPVQENTSNIVYALPKTGLRFKVTTEKVERKRGEFYLYSERYLGLKDVVLNDEVLYKVKSIELETFAVANLNEQFSIEVVGEDVVPNVSLLPSGVIIGINTKFVSEPKKKPVCNLEKNQSDVVPYTEEMLLSNSSSKMAYEAARYIYRLRENRTALLLAESESLPPDGEAYAMSLEQINALESKFVALFKGTETCTSSTEIIEILPEQLLQREVLFRFSALSGVVAPDDLSGAPYFIKMLGGEMLKEEAPLDSVGLYYKQPMPVEVIVLDGSKEVLSEDVLMSQFGRLASLPLGVVSKDVQVMFYPETGAIKALRN